MTPLALILGSLAGAGLYLLIRAALPAQPALSAALENLTNTNDATALTKAPAIGLEDHLGMWTERLATQLPGVVAPHKDLAVINWSSRKFYAQKGTAALLGLLFPVIITCFTFIFGISFPFPLTVGMSLILAVVFFFLPDIEVRQRAAKQRMHYAKVTAAYVDFVALSRLGGAAATQAMRDAALVGDNELFLRIRQMVERSRLRGTSAWGDMKELGEELGVKELNEIADIMRLSGEEGASIWNNLRSHARSMRNAHLRDEQGNANVASERMTLPLVVLATAFIGLLLTPSLLTLITS
ncbi:MAG: hypothetical protein E7A06_12360 [Clostridiales bacterium]|nr:hypothetical protein [Clostridiales bacterium]